MRQFVLTQNLSKNGTIWINGKDFKYLAQVLRLKIGDTICARLPNGSLCQLELQIKEKNRLLLRKINENFTNSSQNGEIEENKNTQSCQNQNIENINAPKDFENFQDFENVEGVQDFKNLQNTQSSKQSEQNIFGSTYLGGVKATNIEENEQIIEQNGSICGFGTIIWLLQCMPKASKLDSIIRQCTEIGVEKIFPIASDRSVYEKTENASNKLNRWERIIKEARQQSASPINTQIFKPQKMAQTLKNVQSLIENITISNKNDEFKICKLVLTEAPIDKKALHTFLAQKPNLVLIAVGSEGGISPNELNELFDFGFKPLHLQCNVLRAETAAIYAVSSVQILMTECAKWQPNA